MFKDWTEELKLVLTSKVSNVVIVETIDKYRINQLLKWISSGTLLDTPTVLDVNVQQGSITSLTDSRTLVEQCSPLTLLSNLDTELRRSRKVTAIIRYITSAEEARLLSRYIVAWSCDPKLFDNYIIVLTASKHLFDYYVRSMCYTITIPLPSESERRALLMATANKKGIHDVPEEVIQASAGLTLWDVQSAAQLSISLRGRLDPEVFKHFKTKILMDRLGVEYVEPSYGFDAVGGYDEVKRFLEEVIVKPIRRPELARKYGLGTPKGVLFFGPPGTGKTYITRALAYEAKLPMIQVNASHVMSRYVGESERTLSMIAATAEALAPCIVFLDEADELAISREKLSATDAGAARRVLGVLLDWLGRSDRKSIVIAATNYIEDIDEAFLRAGRFDAIVPILYPDEKARLEILKIHTQVVRKVPLGDDVDLAALAKETEMWKPSELELLVRLASINAMREEADSVHMYHFKEAMKMISINKDERKQEMQRYMNQLRKIQSIVTWELVS